MNTSYVTPSPDSADLPATAVPRPSATAIIAGALVALAVALTLLVLGAAIGVSAMRPSADVAKGVGIGYSVWLLLSLCAGAFAGGAIAARCAALRYRGHGALYGVVTWALVTVVGASLAGGAIRSTVSGLFGAAKDTAQIAASSPAVNQQAQQQAGALGDQASAAASRAGNVVAQNAEKAKTGATIGLWALFAALLLPLGAALGGGVVGARRPRAEVPERQRPEGRFVERRGGVADRREAHRSPVTSERGAPIPTV